MYTDRVSEAIARFIGQLKIQPDHAGSKHLFPDFAQPQDTEAEQPILPNMDAHVSASVNLEDFDPHIPYLESGATISRVPQMDFFRVIPIEMSNAELHQLPRRQADPLEHATDVGGSRGVPTIVPPGEVAAVINQTLFMSDNDYASVGGHGLAFNPVVEDNQQLEDLIEAAQQVSPIDDLPALHNDSEVPEFMATAQQRLADYVPEEGSDVSVVRADAIEGTFVNGVLVETAPKLADHMTMPDDDGAILDIQQLGIDPDNDAPPVSVSVTTGGNTLLNEAVVTNNWLGSSVVAVNGDHNELNAIVQINVTATSASVSSTINGWSLDTSSPSGAFNIAMFKHIDPTAEADGEGDGGDESVGGFPSGWIVTRVEGDLMVMNSIEQTAFMVDKDVAIVASSGVRTTLTLGVNGQFNEISIEEIGHFYDLIVVGGSVYDLNLIQQMNILVDNDIVGAVEGFSTTGAGSYSTGSNLVWNQASIVEYGGVNTPEAMTDAYQATIDNLASGRDVVDSGILGDAPFAGVGYLRVLYIEGDYFSVTSIKQVNILGDSDQVALAMHDFRAYPEATWTVSTGDNQLVNLASIVDVEANQKTYVGGNFYSDEILIQANLISSGDPSGAGRDPDALVNEAIIFLTDDDDEPIGEQIINPTIIPDGSQADVMQQMIA